MPSNIINTSSIKRSVACYLAFIYTVSWAQPALDGLGESHFISSDVHSSQGDLHDVFNRVKRPSETQFSTRIGTEWMDPDAHSDYQDVAKRQKTVEHDVSGLIPQPQLDPHTSSHSATHDEMFSPMEFEGPQDHHGFYQLAGLPSAPTSPASFLPPQSQHVPLNSGLTFEKEHLMNPTPESMFESMSHHEIGTNDDDLKISLLFEQLQSPQFENTDAREWLPLLDNVHVPPVLPHSELNQAGFQRHSPVELDTHSGQDSIQRPQQLHEPHITNQGPLAPSSSHPSFDGELSGELNENDRVSSKDSVDRDQVQIYSESPRDTNSDESTHEHTSQQSIPLEKVQLPRNIMDDKFLELFTYKFTQHLHHVFTHSSTGARKNDYPIAGLPTRISRNSDSYMIWIEHDPNILAPSQNSIQRSQKLSYHFGGLIQWFLFINTAVLRKLNAGKTTLDHSEFDSHQQLIDWLFKESFHPEHCAPILGMISFVDFNAFKKGKEFGPTQRLLIKFLSSVQQPGEAPQVAISIIRLYYYNFQPEIWKGLGILDEMDFDWEIESLIVSGIQSQMKKQ
ncbi:hypothetical protein PGT21_032107 [Puccinia graminis f. sp. tritici]|uniref:Uncharacterized protein n=1 Tax=Puccinia graminis f. sp. tritici TaxID=56615 RepID=A0A5B0QK49_PUCGR|nr:hypothetical protein PGT21_032107 [Puccinia graminis f. sp. tritici]